MRGIRILLEHLVARILRRADDRLQHFLGYGEQSALLTDALQIGVVVKRVAGTLLAQHAPRGVDLQPVVHGKVWQLW